MAIAAVFFFAPLALFAAGVGPGSSERRGLAPFPTDWTSWSAFDQLGAYVNDHVPLRGSVTRLRAELTQDLFHEAPPGNGAPVPTETATTLPLPPAERDFVRLPPVPEEPPGRGNSSVTVGKDGWLYLTDEFVKECNPGTSRAQVVRGLQRLASILTASGRRFVLTLGPDKSTTEPEHLPDDHPYASCSARAKQETYSLLAGAGLSGYVDARALIDEAETMERRSYYQRKDTHWNGLAGSLVARELVARLDPALLDGTTVEESVERYTGDLTDLLGAPSSDQTLDARIVRDGVTWSRQELDTTPGVQAERTRAVSTAAPLVDGPSVLLGDSFAEATLPHLAPFFEDLTWWHLAGSRNAPRTTAELIGRSRTVVLVWVERSFADPFYGVLWSDAFLDQLERTLPPVP